jgi:hypothetical protein
VLGPLVVPEDEAPVEPEVFELLDVPADPVEDGEFEVALLDEPMPEADSELEEPLELGEADEPLLEEG